MDPRREQLPVSPSAEYEAADPAGVLLVSVDSQGRVQDVAIDRRWRDRLDANMLAAALLSTYRVARMRAIEAVVAGLASHASGHRPGDVDPVPLPDPATDRRAWLLWIQDVHAEVAARRERRDQLDALVRKGARLRAGPHGYLTAIVEGNEIVEIRGDARQVWFASTERLRQEAIAVLSAAQESIPD